MTGLVPDRDYTIFMLPVDLYGNTGEIKEVTFRTEPIPPPVTFKLKTKSSIPDQDMLDALSLVAGVPASRFKIIYKPNLVNINTDEQEVQDAMDQSNLEYEIQLLPDYTQDATSPYDLIKKIEDDKETLFEELPQLVADQDIGATGAEVTEDKQAIPYEPILVDVTNFYATFNVSLQFTGTIYGVILPSDEPAPNAIQIRYGLTALNYQINEYYYLNKKLEIDLEKKYRIWPSDEMKFTFLYHSTKYTAYFIADKETFGNPILMRDEDIVKVEIKTLREIFKVGKRHALEVASGLVPQVLGALVTLTLGFVLF